MSERYTGCPELRIGAYCRNRGRELCINDCAPQGHFEHLEPLTLEAWELPPELPPYGDLFQLNHHVVRGVFYLALHYQQRQITKDA